MNQSYPGYFRSPTVHQDQVVFICEDELWQASLNGGAATRLTNSRGIISTPVFSPDGQWLACCGSEEGNDDIYILSSKGGPLQRLTHINTLMKVVGWSPNCDYVIFWSTHQSTHHNADACLYTVPVAGGPVQKLPYGPAHYIDYSPEQTGIIIGRHAAQNFRWKRYRGGMIGEIWIKLPNKRQFTRILQDLPGNPVCPLWINEHIYFVSDHEGIGNLYSCNINGKGIQQKTFQKEFYVRSPSTDGQTIVYHAGGKLFGFDLSSNREKQIEVECYGSRRQTQRKFFYGDEYLENATLHPNGHAIALTARGTLFSMPLWEQAVNQHGKGSGTRSRLAQWLADGKLAAIYDQDKEAEKLGIFPFHPQQQPELLLDLPSGRVQRMLSAPYKSQLALTT
ncbi:MAG: PD40 domain-containing protein, partial [SAR324 cluster bacterium]|nr:PD40 domain-containing protein [SAR324 cluster bacterium]